MNPFRRTDDVKPPAPKSLADLDDLPDAVHGQLAHFLRMSARKISTPEKLLDALEQSLALQALCAARSKAEGAGVTASPLH